MCEGGRKEEEEEKKKKFEGKNQIKLLPWLWETLASTPQIARERLAATTTSNPLNEPARRLLLFSCFSDLSD